MTKIQITNAMGGTGKKTLLRVGELAEFTRRGQAAQQAVDAIIAQAVDAIIAAERAKQKP